ncbi:hypothetical protein FRX31_015697 [Thalictrum thalictroides]|uniref:Uncharacterized protein n=1 Tax=Thalictrum thalictroides TaxID=46969 RepID=A0A7J6WDN3_THATH|nr:hypothetical protein FRX31_015697 [Thalictrum thalictroides]
MSITLFGEEMCPGVRPSTLPRESDRNAESHILLDPYGRRSVNSKDLEVHPQEISSVSFQTLGGENVLSHTTNVGPLKNTDNMDTIATKKIGLQGNCTGVVVGIPEPTKSTKYVDLGTFYPAAGQVEEHSRHPASNSSGTTDVSKVVTGKKKVLKTKSNGRISQHILAQNLSANSNDRMRYTLLNVKAPETCSLPQSRIKRKTSSFVEVGVIDKEKVASLAKKFPEKEVKASSHNSGLGKLFSDACEPRRSSRISQPTLRLLEGLQTSLTPGMHSVSHEKDTKLSAGTRGNKRSCEMRQKW